MSTVSEEPTMATAPRYIEVNHSSTGVSPGSTTISSPSPPLVLPTTSISPGAGCGSGTGNEISPAGTTPAPSGATETELPTPPGPPTNGNTTTNNVYLIGLEFVRQYYTVLHQGPLYLHRFYSETSVFVHDDSKAVHGQLEIRERIQQLNFRNCVAKILQVDSQETLGNGVVIQVRGELSNNGKPLRRFMQTFVLAPQSPKRYYVRNDIFHYEDDDPKEELNTATGVLESSMSDETEHHNEIEKSDEEGDDDDSEHDRIPSVSACSPTSLPEVHGSKMEKGDVLAGAGGDMNHRDHHEHQNQDDRENVVEVSVLHIDSKTVPENEPRRPSHGFITTPTPSSEGDEESGAKLSPPPAVPAAAPVAPAPKTYANLFKQQNSGQQPFSSTTSANSTTTSTTSTSPFPNRPNPPNEETPGGGPTSPGPVSPQPPQEHHYGKSGLPPRGGHGHYGHGRDRGGFHHRDRRERLSSRSSNATNNDDTGSVDGDGQSQGKPSNPIPRYPDSHQLFVGNLPHTATQTEIKDIFSVYGRVAEVKILKPGMKNSGPKVPYFCFVIYEKPGFAQAALNDKSKITMRMPDNSNRRLNVEEKRPRENYPYFHRQGGDNANSQNQGQGHQNQHQGNQFRGSQGQGQGQHSNNVSSASTAPAGGQGQGSGTGGNQNRQGQTSGGGGGPRTHTRTFRGSHRGGGGGGGAPPPSGGAR